MSNVPAKPTSAEWKALVGVLETDLGLDALIRVISTAFTDTEIAKLVQGEDPGRDITKADTEKIVKALADEHPGDRAADIEWAMSVAVRAWGDTPRMMELVEYARLKVAEHEAKTDPARLEPIQDPNNRLLNPGRIIVWFGDGGGKVIEQRDTGYYAGRLGDRKAYNFEAVVVRDWDAFCDIYEQISGDKSMREGGPHVVAVYTEVASWWNPSPGKSYYKDSGEKTDRIPDMVNWVIRVVSGHEFRFELRNRGDYAGRAGNGHGDVYLNGERRATWCFNRQQHNGKSVGFRA